MAGRAAEIGHSAQPGGYPAIALGQWSPRPWAMMASPAPTQAKDGIGGQGPHMLSIRRLQE
jgi:hypothetical protein